MSIEQIVATGRVITILAAIMTPEQQRAAAREIRDLDGDAIARKFFHGVAAGLDQHADETERTPA